MGFSDTADRLWLRWSTDSTCWWLTRRLALRWICSWSERLEATASKEESLWLGPREQRMALEHDLALERDEKPAPAPAPALAASQANRVLASVELHVTGRGTRCLLMGEGARLPLRLTRRQSHRMLAALIRQATLAGWLSTPALPDWLQKSEKTPGSPPS